MTFTRRSFIRVALPVRWRPHSGRHHASRLTQRQSPCGSDTSPTIRHEPDAIATDQNLWAKHGLEPDLKIFTNGPIQIQALGAGQSRFRVCRSGRPLASGNCKAKLVAINVLGLSDRVIAQKGINSVADLKGKKVASRKARRATCCCVSALPRPA